MERIELGFVGMGLVVQVRLFGLMKITGKILCEVLKAVCNSTLME